jgi:hypothetical protein
LPSRRALLCLRWLFIAACLVLGVAIPRAASAQAADADRSWRRGERPPESPQHFAFELRFGPYKPAIDNAFAASPGPYESTFGNDTRFYFGLELDWQALRIPKVGTLGAGFGWGFTHMSANAKLQATGQPSAEDTSLSIMPMYGVGVLRVDVLAKETPIPLVAYGKAGLGYGIYWAGNDLGTQLRGHTWGTHFAVGGMVLLDALDEHASIEIDNEWGINNTYFFFEWMFSNLDGFGAFDDPSVMRIGTHTWVLGIAFEM